MLKLHCSQGHCRGVRLNDVPRLLPHSNLVERPGDPFLVFVVKADFRIFRVGAYAMNHQRAKAFLAWKSFGYSAQVKECDEQMAVVPRINLRKSIGNALLKPFYP